MNVYYNGDYYTCNVCNIDIDECAEETSQCGQECSNTIGSFICSCVDGYTLDIDGRKCNGNSHNILH